MYTIATEYSFDSAHFLAGYEGKCSNIHGHRWCVAVEVANETLKSDGQLRGMIVDFKMLKEDLRELLDYYDHALIIEEGSLKPKTVEALNEEGFRMIALPFRPTAENFARFFFDEMGKKGYSVARATVYETPNNCATYSVMPGMNPDMTMVNMAESQAAD